MIEWDKEVATRRTELLEKLRQLNPEWICNFNRKGTHQVQTLTLLHWSSNMTGD